MVSVGQRYFGGGDLETVFLGDAVAVVAVEKDFLGPLSVLRTLELSHTRGVEPWSRERGRLSRGWVGRRWELPF